METREAPASEMVAVSSAHESSTAPANGAAANGDAGAALGSKPSAGADETSAVAPASPAAAMSSEAGDEAAAPAPFNRKKKRKVALFMAYVGAGYHGMQRNPGVPTIEDELFKAIYAAGGIAEANSNDAGFNKLHWMRAARTDKGVSAVGQVVSLRMILDPPGMVERINDSLPRQVRVFGYGRATNGFDARKHCDKRRYEYILPVWAFDPDVCLLSKEAGVAAATNGDAETEAAAAPSAAEDAAKAVDDSAGAALPELSPAELAELESSAEAQSASYAFDATEQARVTAILRQYEGTHNFHNFTVRTGAHEAQARRYILSFRCEGVTEIAGSRWVRLVVVGQSFMLHQIRKMVGMALAVARGLAPADSIRQALLSLDTLHTPMAPELGLFLDECYFDAYNAGFGERLHEALVLSDFQRPVEEFKAAWLYPHIARTDAAEHINASWIRQLHALSFEPGAWALRSSGTRASSDGGESRRPGPPRTRGGAKRGRVGRGWGSRDGARGRGGGAGGRGANKTALGGNADEYSD